MRMLLLALIAVSASSLGCRSTHKEPSANYYAPVDLPAAAPSR